MGAAQSCLVPKKAGENGGPGRRKDGNRGGPRARASSSAAAAARNLAAWNYPRALQRPQKSSRWHTWHEEGSSIPFPRVYYPVEVGPVLGEPVVDISTLYFLRKELGRGRRGATRLCTNRIDGREYACKSIPRSALVKSDSVKLLRKELTILRYLSGLPSIVRLDRAYEDWNSVHLVTELCWGGSLREKVEELGRFPEERAKRVFRQLVGAVHSCHMMGVVHRDLKLENVVLRTGGLDWEVKILDFGSATFFEEGEVFNERKGSSVYMSPEMLHRSYGKQTDVWSCGVILYCLLFGQAPRVVGGKWTPVAKDLTARQIHAQIEAWPPMSDDARDLLAQIFVPDPAKRITTAQILDHFWIRHEGQKFHLPTAFAFLERLRQIRAMNEIKMIALMVMASSVGEEEYRGYKLKLRGMFQEVGASISPEEFMSKVFVLGCRLKDEDLWKLMDTGNTGTKGDMNFLEFQAAMLPVEFFQTKKNVNIAWAFLKYTTRPNALKKPLNVREMGDALVRFTFKATATTIESVLSEADMDKDGMLSFEEFVQMMLSTKKRSVCSASSRHSF